MQQKPQEKFNKRRQSHWDKVAKKMEGPAKIVTVIPDSGFKYMSKIFNPQWLKEIGLGHLAD